MDLHLVECVAERNGVALWIMSDAQQGREPLFI